MTIVSTVLEAPVPEISSDNNDNNKHSPTNTNFRTRMHGYHSLVQGERRGARDAFGLQGLAPSSYTIL